MRHSALSILAYTRLFFCFFFFFFNIKCAKLKTLFLQHGPVPAGERSLLSARQFLISHNVRMSPSSIQFQLQFRFFSFLFYLHLMSSSVDVVFFVFFLTLIIESEQ